jgi:hypothetical protein
VNWAAAAVVLGMTSSAAAADEPTVLSDLELEAVTAAGVLVDVSSFAAGFGADRVRTLTDAKTVAAGGRRVSVGVGLTLGHGYACCGESADVEVGSAVLGVGDMVRGDTLELKYDDGISAQGLAAGYVIALSFHKPLVKLEDLRSALVNVRSGLPTSPRK